jgi:L-aspartate semialdehyde sulfurtransferase
MRKQGETLDFPFKITHYLIYTMKTYEEINKRIEAKKALVLTAEEIIDYVDKKGLETAAKEVDVVTTATFGPMCSSGCFINFGHSKPKIRMSEAWIEDVLVYTGIAAVDVYLGATQLRHNDPANMYYPGDFPYGGGHVIEDLVAGKKIQLFALSYGTDDYPLRELRTYFTIHDLNQAIMVNPRNCYQNYNIAINCSEKPIYTYLGYLKPGMKNLTYCSAGQLSPLLNDPLYETIGVGTKIWLAGAQGHVYAEGTQHCPVAKRGENDVPMEGAGTLALTGNMKEMNPRFVRGVSLKGYGVSLALGVGIPIPVLNEEILKRTTVRDRDIYAPVVDYSRDYPQRDSHIICRLNYEELKKGEVTISNKGVEVSSLSSYNMALEIAEIVKDEIKQGEFLLSRPIKRLPLEQGFRPLEIRDKNG